MRITRSFLRIAASVLFAASFAPQFAAAAENAVPEALAEWTAWVNRDSDHYGCPLLNQRAGEAEENFHCSWSGPLDLAIGGKSGKFSQYWKIYARRPVPLPGNQEAWPLAVTANGDLAPVVSDEQSRPVLWLAPGEYRIEGEFAWEQKPEYLAVPQEVALIDLRIADQRIFPLSRESGSIWLGGKKSEVKESDALEIRVFRKLTDGIPARLTTKIQLGISGQGREETLGKVLPAGWQPIDIESGELNAALHQDGMLVIQAKPGHHEITLEARAVSPLTEATAPKLAPPWPGEEVWSYQSAPQLRITQAESDMPVDPRQAQVEEAWANLPAFIMQDASTLKIAQKSRGLSSQDQNRLTLNRQIWVDFSGQGATFQDRIAGSMVRDWRLNLAQPMKLVRAETQGEGLLITQGNTPQLTGVELRERQVDLSTMARMEKWRTELPIAGWQHRFDGVQSTLHLPPGYRLYAAFGADQAPESWLQRWRLLDIFLVALATLLAFWVGRWLYAALVAIYLLLGYQEPDAPMLMLIVLFSSALLAQLTGDGRFAKWMNHLRNAALVTTAILALPFLYQQVRLAIYPQLEQNNVNAYADYGMDGRARSETGLESVPAASQPATIEAEGDIQAQAMEEKANSPKMIKKEALNSVLGYRNQSISKNKYAPNTIIQAGNGIPNWSWSAYHLNWSGPILPDQSVRLVLSKPWLTRSLRLLSVLLLSLILLQLARRFFGIKRQAQPLATSLLLGLAILPSLASAQNFPDETLLEQLREHVQKLPDCAPNCGDLGRALITAEKDKIYLALELHAAAEIALPLPTNPALLDLNELTLDGEAVKAAYQSAEQELWIVVPRGVHNLAMGWTAANAEKIPLRFPRLRPARVEFASEDWEASGMRNGILLTDALDLVRMREKSDDAPGIAQQFKSFVHVARKIDLDLDWRMETVVTRIAPKRTAFTMVLPLLNGERLTSSAFTVENGKIIVPFQADQDQIVLVSQLARTDALHFSMPDLSQYSESWEFTVSPTWNAKFSGVPAAYPNNETEWVHAFNPLPGEKLDVLVTRPMPVAGKTAAIDQVNLTTQLGKRATEHHLSFSLRSTQGGQHAIVLPSDIEVTSVNVAGEKLNIQPEQGKLSIPIRPGSQNVAIDWRETKDITRFESTPNVDLQTDASNIHLQINPPYDRWLLFASGPRIGPAILYWGEIAAMALFAFFLARTRRTPLRFKDWLLLGLGFSTFSWIPLVIFAAWLFALDLRARRQSARAGWFDLAQIAIAILTLVALGGLMLAIWGSLLSSPDMHVVGNGSSSQGLRWFADQTSGALPVAKIFSVSLWWYKFATLCWALWLANALLHWMRWGWQSFGQGGFWRWPAKPAPDQTPGP